MASRSSRKRPSAPLEERALGPDKKGRFWLTLPNSDRKLYFYGGVPGEPVRVRRGKRGRKGEQGDLLEVLEPSALRREAPCRHFGVCGGCTLQHLPEDAALRLKAEPHYRTLAAFEPTALLHPPVPSPQEWEYRNKVELTFLRDFEDQTTLGFLRRGRFDRGVDLGKCWLTPLTLKTVEELRGWLKRHGLKGWNPRRSDGDLRYFLYRHSSCSDQDLAALVVNASMEWKPGCREELVEILQRQEVTGALIIQQSSVGGAVVPDRVEPLYGKQTLLERLGALTFDLGWNSFFQVNPPAYQRMLETMATWRRTAKGMRILDLFCGVGSIGLSLYRPGDRLSGVELVEQAVLDARGNALRNQIPAVFEQRSAEDWDRFETDLLILDPPRAGCHPKLISLLEQRAPAQELFYVSCNPHQLAEELPALSRRYRLLQAQAFDFFPQTHHLEFLLHFERRCTLA